MKKTCHFTYDRVTSIQIWISNNFSNNNVECNAKSNCEEIEVDLPCLQMKYKDHILAKVAQLAMMKTMT